MYDYFTVKIIAIDAALLACAAMLSVLIIAYSTLKERSARKRNAALLAIKQNVYDMVLSGAKPSAGTCQPFTENVTSRQFIDVATNRNRSAVFFNESEREALKSCLKTPEKTSGLIRILSTKANKWKKIEAALSLGYLGFNGAVPAIKEMLSSKDDDIKYFAILALGQINTEDSASALLEALRTRDFARQKIVSVLEQFPPDANAGATVLLKDRDPAVRFWGVRLLTKSNPRKHLKDAASMITDRSEKVRSAACEFLGAAGGTAARDALLQSLRDPVWSVRASAVKSLVKISGAAAVPAIMPLLKDNSLTVVEAVRDALMAHIEAAIPHIYGIIGSGNTLAAKVIAEAITNSGYLKKIVNDCLSNDSDISADAMRIFEAVIKSGSHFGVETALAGMDDSRRSRALDIIKKTNPILAEHIEKIFEGTIQEL